MAARVKCSEGAGGAFWVAGWLFAIGYVHLTFWQAVLALLIWPWYLGRALGLGA